MTLRPRARQSVSQVGNDLIREAERQRFPDRHRAKGWEVPRQPETQLEDQSEAKYRGLLEAAPDAMVVVNQAGAIVLLNVQAEKQFGYPRDELLGQPVTNIIPEGFAERLVADDLRSTEDALAQVIGTGIELVARRRDGTEFPIEIMLSPLKSAEGILVTAAIRDISVRLAAEAKYRGLLEAAPDAMVVVNQAGAIVLLNVQAEKQFGYPWGSETPIRARTTPVRSADAVPPLPRRPRPRPSPRQRWTGWSSRRIQGPRDPRSPPSAPGAAADVGPTQAPGHRRRSSSRRRVGSSRVTAGSPSSSLRRPSCVGIASS